MTVQTQYPLGIAAAFAGMLYSPQDQDIWSFAAEGAAGIGFGLGVSRGTAPDEQVVLGGAAPIGISVRSLERTEEVAGSLGYAETETVAVLRRGYIYAVCADGCSPGDPVLADAATGALSVAAGNAIDGATWESVTAAGEIGIIRIA